MNTTVLERRIELQGCSNFRDLGGYRTSAGATLNWGRLFRSDSIHSLTRSDAAKARQNIGIRTVIDLRTLQESDLYGTGLLRLPPTTYHHVPLLRDMDAGRDWRRWCPSLDLSEAYFKMLTEAGPSVVAAIKILAKAEAYPALFHCMAGKDRTGVLAAVMLSILGVSEEDIIQDYALTEHYLDSAASQQGFGARPRYSSGDLPSELLRARPETMRSFLCKVKERHNSMRDFVISQGVSDEDILCLEGIMVSTTVQMLEE